MNPRPTTGQRLTRAAVMLLLLAAVLGLGYWLYKLVSDPAEKPRKRAVQEITLHKPPPPPPPPKTPPPPPPPRMDQEKIDVPKPDAQPDKPAEAPPPGPDLAVDAAGSGSGDGFGLVGKPGGTDLLATGIGGGGAGAGGDQFAWYSALVKERIQDAVEEAARRDKKLRAAGNVQRTVHVWVGAGGTITRVELVGSGERPELDQSLRDALRNVAAVREAAPGNMPQPIRLRITTRS
ncbi:MAG: TonB-dependent receptor [Comamonadaceae bacterium]|nr:TonB-dependent receptor [Comamonadaceae bacterium]